MGGIEMGGAVEQVNVVTLGLLLFVACVVAIVTRRIGLPYTIGLVVAGIALSLIGYRSRIGLTPELIFTVLLWGGLRGALALALALASPSALPEHDALIGVAFAVVAFSIFVQGSTMPGLLRRAATSKASP